MSSEKEKAFFYKQIKQIKMKKCGYLAKIKLMEGILDRLNSINNNPQLIKIRQFSKQEVYCTPQSKSLINLNKKSCFSENQSTSYSFFSDSPSIYIQNEAEEYEQKIMEKRVVKFEVNEQIQAMEDDLFQMQKVVETKRSLNDQLAKHIQKRMKQIGSNTKIIKEDSYLPVFGNSIKTQRKQQPSRDMMNMTISGASGFGFANKNKIEGTNNNANEKVNSATTNKASNPSNARNDILVNHFNMNIVSQQQRKKAKSHYLNKSIGTVTGLFKSILK